MIVSLTEMTNRKHYRKKIMINPVICSCCGEIWNSQNLKNIPLGKHELHLCPNCYKEYTKPFDSILSKLKNLKWDIVNENLNAVSLSDTEDIISCIEKYIKIDS